MRPAAEARCGSWQCGRRRRRCDSAARSRGRGSGHGLERPRIRPDRRRNREGLGGSLGMRLCRSPEPRQAPRGRSRNPPSPPAAVSRRPPIIQPLRPSTVTRYSSPAGPQASWSLSTAAIRQAPARHLFQHSRCPEACVPRCT